MVARSEDQQANLDLETLRGQMQTMALLIKQHHEVILSQSGKINQLSVDIAVLREADKRSDEIQVTVDQISSSMQNLATQDALKEREIETMGETLKDLTGKISNLEAVKSCDIVDHDQILNTKHEIDILHKDFVSVQEAFERAKIDRDRQIGELVTTFKGLKADVDEAVRAMNAWKIVKRFLIGLISFIGVCMSAYITMSEHFTFGVK